MLIRAVNEADSIWFQHRNFLLILTLLLVSNHHSLMQNLHNNSLKYKHQHPDQPSESIYIFLGL